MRAQSRKRVRFDSNEVEVFVDSKKDYDTDTDTDTDADAATAASEANLSEEEQFRLRRERRKRKHWYTQEDMAPARAEAKQIIRMIHAVGGDIEKIDHSKLCVIGLEKFHNGHENERCRRLLIRSILVRQEMNKSMGLTQHDADQSLFDISELLSKSFVEFARWQGALNAAHAYGSANSNGSSNAIDNETDTSTNTSSSTKATGATTTSSTLSSANSSLSASHSQAAASPEPPRRQQSVTALC
jgi:hypothetical protein